MSVIVWDGKTLAADRAVMLGELKLETCKLWKTDEGAIAICGDVPLGESLKEWYKSGKDKEKWPESQRSEKNWATLIVATRDGVVYYEGEPYPITVRDIHAWGSGKEVALGAMAARATAIEAVEIACMYSPCCGFGSDFVHINQPLNTVRSSKKPMYSFWDSK